MPRKMKLNTSFCPAKRKPRLEDFDYTSFLHRDLDQFLQELHDIRTRATKEGFKKVRITANGVGCLLTFQVEK